ncbi:MAG: ABC transporter ATP-binding protein [Planctomycetaceae bacterium]|nr:ABC transporter ATP-binding protein [Planctomycetaceae bacterium]
MIDIQGVTKVHKRGETEVHALRGVSCQIEKGALTFILGPSGSGKSTLLYLIGALDEPTAGKIIVADRSLGEFSESERDEYRRNDVGFIFQNFNLIGNLDSVDNVLAPFIPQGISSEQRTRAVELLEQVGMGERLDHRPNQLSGGEQQRVAIARALLKQPSIVLADEPTGELDSENGAEVFSYLRRLQSNIESTIVVVTHDQSYVQESDRVVRLKDGRVAE